MIVPIILLRRKIIIKKLSRCGAFTEEDAKTLAEAGVFNPHAFPKVTEDLVRENKIIKTKSMKYYINNQ